MRLPLSLVRTLPAVTLTLALGGGCVTAKQHEALGADLAATRLLLADSGAENNALSIALDEAERALEMHEARIADLEQQLVIAEQRAAGAETQLAELIKQSSDLEASIEQMRAALEAATRERARAQVRAGLYRAVLEKFQALIDGGQLEIKVVDGRMVLELDADVLFASGSAKLSTEGETVIAEVGALLAEIPERNFQVEGHTDNRPIKTKTYPSNWQLAAARAMSVVSAMLDAGMPAARISAATFADSRPAATNQSKEGRAKNRRIEIVMVPDLSDLPGADELIKMIEAHRH